MKADYNRKRIRQFYFLVIPILLIFGVSIYLNNYQLSGLLLIILGIIIYIYHKDQAAFIYYKRYDLSMQFHTQDINEIEKYGYQDYEKLKSDSIKLEIAVIKLISIVSIVFGLLFFLGKL